MHTIKMSSGRTDDAPAPALRDHLFRRVLVTEHRTARVHGHLLVERRHRCCAHFISAPYCARATQRGTILSKEKEKKTKKLTFQERFQGHRGCISYHL
jgi:hypothetical protein